MAWQGGLGKPGGSGRQAKRLDYSKLAGGQGRVKVSEGEVESEGGDSGSEAGGEESDVRFVCKEFKLLKHSVSCLIGRKSDVAEVLLRSVFTVLFFSICAIVLTY